MSGVTAGAASPWVARWAPLAKPCGIALDLACGSGRHVRFLAELGMRVVAVDRDRDALCAVAAMAPSGIETIESDLENGPWPLVGRTFDLVVVTNYLWRPLLERIVDAVAPGGMLVYETFLVGHERFGRPTNPDFLLKCCELRSACEPRLQTLAFEEGVDGDPPNAMRQRICARCPGDGDEASWREEARSGTLRAIE